MPITHPRISSGTIVCTVVLEVEKKSIIPKPAPARVSTAIVRLRLSAKIRRIDENNQTPPKASLRGESALPDAVVRASRLAPTPLAPNNSP
jgi:hypothetical protein